jgi:hypothetical protein
VSILENSAPAEREQGGISLPRPLWIGMATVVLLAGSLALRVCVPVYRQQVAIREIQRMGGSVEREEAVPHWLRPHLDWRLVEMFDDVD